MSLLAIYIEIFTASNLTPPPPIASLQELKASQERSKPVGAPDSEDEPEEKVPLTCFLRDLCARAFADHPFRKRAEGADQRAGPKPSTTRKRLTLKKRAGTGPRNAKSTLKAGRRSLRRRIFITSTRPAMGRTSSCTRSTSAVSTRKRAAASTSCRQPSTPRFYSSRRSHKTKR